jgi:hypothetical protein
MNVVAMVAVWFGISQLSVKISRQGIFLLEARQALTTNPDRDVIAAAYQGEFGWRFLDYIPSKLEVEFYEDVKPFVNEKEYPELIDINDYYVVTNVCPPWRGACR